LKLGQGTIQAERRRLQMLHRGPKFGEGEMRRNKFFVTKKYNAKSKSIMYFIEEE